MTTIPNDKPKSLKAKAPNGRQVPAKPETLPAVVKGTVPVTFSKAALIENYCAELHAAIGYVNVSGDLSERWFFDLLDGKVDLDRPPDFWRERVRAMMPSLPKMRAAFESGQRSATVEEIATALCTFVASMPIAANIDTDVWTAVVTEGVIDERPTANEWAFAVRALADRCKFLPALGDILQELKAARKKTQQFALALSQNHKKIIQQKDGPGIAAIIGHIEKRRQSVAVVIDDEGGDDE